MGEQDVLPGLDDLEIIASQEVENDSQDQEPSYAVPGIGQRALFGAELGIFF